MNSLFRLLLFVALIASSCSDSDEFPKLDFVGNWLISEAKRDGIDQPEWKGLSIEIAQANSDGGVYAVVNSPNDSIWKASGSWKRLDKNDGFLRDETIDVTYSIDRDQLSLTLFVLRVRTCNDFPCTLQVQSQWLFIADPI